MSEITQPPPDLKTQDTNARVNRLSAAADHHTQQNRSAEQKTAKTKTETEPEKITTHHDPAVTLASTLSKLDSGSYLKATVEGIDSEGRTIINSELGTYLVTLENQKIEEFKKEEFNNIQKGSPIEIRILAIDKEIKAEIIRSSSIGDEIPKTYTIPVKLTLTDLAKHIDNSVLEKPYSYATTPLDDIKSQYQVSTLYKAERIAREIADKLDNLPLPTSSPNYRVYGNSGTSSTIIESPTLRQASPNIFIQEVSNNSENKSLASQPVPTALLERILGQSINVQVIKTLPREPSPLLAGLPDAVVKEISALTPLDYVSIGQTLNINVAALAIPYTASSQPSNTAVPLNNENQNIVQNQAFTTNKNNQENINPTQNSEAPVSSYVKDAVISGLIIDTSHKTETNIDRYIENTKGQDASQVAHSTPYTQKNGPQSFLKNDQITQNNDGKTYYLATPTSVLKFKSSIPLIPGTVVSFTVQPNSTLPPQESDGKNTSTEGLLATNKDLNISNIPTSASSSTNEAGSAAANPLPINILNKIENLPLQDLDQLPQEWASISLALTALNASSANIAAILASRIPNLQNPEQLTSTMFFFLSAIKSSQPARTWVGPDVASRLRQLGAGKILDRIDNDFTRISRLTSDSSVGEWRPHLVPMHNGPDISAIPILTKQIIGDDDKKNKKDPDKDKSDIKATRFILELNFSQFGSVLVDGLLKDTRLDIMLKSAKSIPHTIKIKLVEKYKDALKKNAFEGEMVINDNINIDLSVTKMIETMIHKTSIEKKI